VSFVRTVLGDIRPGELGACYAHEHIIIDSSFTTSLTPDFLLDSVDKAVAELREFHAAGGRAMVDSMPCGGGRNISKLAEVSYRSSVHIVAPTGLHLRKYYPDGHWCERLDANRIAGLFAADIQEGADRNDYNGPEVERTRFRCGVIKVAGGWNKLNDHERKLFEAAAIAHAETGAPILTHTEKGTAALEQIAILRRFGVPYEKIVLSHLDRNTDAACHREVLATGVFVEYDSAFRWPADTENHTLALILKMAEAGFLDQLLLGMDAARRSYWKQYGGQPGLTFLLTAFTGRLLGAGLAACDLDRIFIANPRRAYAFIPGRCTDTSSLQ
jgi:predicted metal-dependent phosphotriesterase family hydrolase